MKRGKLGRTTAHRKALFRSVITALFLHDRIRTTEAKAKQIKPVAERLVSLAKNGDLHSRRLAAEYLDNKDAVKRLFETIGPKYKERPGGYTRVLKIAPRRGDAAPVVILELL